MRLREETNYTVLFSEFLVRIRKSEYVWSYFAQIISILCSLTLVHCISNFFSSDDYSKYIISKRYISAFHTLCLLGMGVSIPKFISSDLVNKRTNVRTTLYAGIVLLCVSTIIFITIGCHNSSYWAGIVFNDVNYSPLIIAGIIYVSSLLFYSLAYRALLGILKIRLAISVSIVWSIYHVVSILIVSTIEAFFVASAICNFVVFVVALRIAFNSTPQSEFATASLRSEISRILRYCPSRFLADMSYEGMFLLPVIFFTTRFGLDYAAAMGFALMMFSLGISLIAPISTVLLPRSSYAFERGDRDALKLHVDKLLKMNVLLTFLMIGVFLAFYKIIVNLLYPAGGLNVEPFLLSIVVAQIPFSIFLSLRSPLDAFYSFSINGYILFGALCIILLGSALGCYLGSYGVFLIFFSMSSFFLGFTSYYIYNRI